MSLRLDLHLLLRRTLPILVIAFMIIVPALSSVRAASRVGNLAAAPGLQGEAKELKGKVDMRPVGKLFGDWTIAGQNISALEAFPTTPATATVFLGFGPDGPQVGACVDVNYYEANPTTRIALTIAPDNDCAGAGAPTRLEFKGKIKSRAELGANGSWTITDKVGDKVFEISAATFFEGYAADTRPIANACVEVSYVVLNGKNMALRIRPDDTCGGTSSDHSFRGPVDSRPTDKVGNWVIGGQAFAVTVDSAFASAFSVGQPASGDCVGLTYSLSGTVRTVATIFPSNCAEESRTGVFESHGLESELPNSGVWTINNVKYSTDTATAFHEQYGNFGIGVCLQVHYKKDLYSNARMAVSIETEPSFRCTRSAEDHELYGLINKLPDTTGQLGPWTIGNLDVRVVPETTLTGGPFTLGQLVKIKFQRAGDGSLIAIEIKVKRSPETEQDRRGKGKAYGVISARPTDAPPVGEWVIGSKNYAVTANTLTPLVIPVVNDCVEVYFQTDSANARTALKITKANLSECQDATNGNSELSRVYSSVTAMPSTGYVGTWTAAGVDYRADGDTLFSEERGPLVVGAFVEVRYVEQLDKSLLAKHISTIVPPGAGDNNHIGKIEGLPTTTAASISAATLAASLASTITVGSITYTIDAGTLLDGALTNGMTVLVNSYTDAQGKQIATQVSATSASISYLPLVRK